MDKKLIMLADGIVKVFFSIICLYLFIISLFETSVMAYTDEHIFYVKDIPWILFPGIILFCVLWSALKKRWDRAGLFIGKKGLMVITVLWFLLFSVWIMATRMEPVHDQFEVFYAAKDLLQGNFACWEKGAYLYTYAFQNSTVLLYVPFHALFGTKAYLMVAFFNLGCWFLAIIGISRLCEDYFERRVAVLTYVCLLWFLPMWGYVPFVYGTVPGLCFAVWGMRMEQMYEKKESIKYLFLSGFFLMFAVMWKSNYLIFVVAVLLLLMVHAIRTKSIKPLFGIPVILCFYFLQAKTVPVLMHVITSKDTGNGIPFIAWVAMGFRDSNIAPGYYNRFTVLTYEACNYNRQDVIVASMEEIRKNLQLFSQDSMYGLRFFARKLAAEWNGPDFEAFTIMNRKNYGGTLPYLIKDILYNGGIVNSILLLIMDAFQSLLLFGVILYLFLERKKELLIKALPAVVFLGGFLFHIFWEGKGQYTLPYFLMLLPYALAGYEKLTFQKKEWKLFLAVGICVGILVIWPGKIVNTIVKTGTDTADHLWYCGNVQQWKEETYVRENS